MTDELEVREISDTVRIIDERKHIMLRLIEKEMEQAVNAARNTALEEAKREAVGISAEARRRGEEIVHEAKKKAEGVIAEAKNRAQTMLGEAARQRAMSAPPPRGVPPPFVSNDGDRISPRRTPVFWA
jgi:cell division septum initiation protein DivIVA